MTTETARSNAIKGSARLPALLLLAAPVLALQKALVMAPALAILAALLLAGMAPPRVPVFRAALGRHRWPLLVLLLLLVWCLAASFWSFNPLFSLRSVLMLAGTILGGWITVVAVGAATAERQRSMALALAAGLAIAAAAMLTAGIIERARLADIGRVLWNMDAATTVVAVLVWPVSAWLMRLGRRRAAAGLWLLSFAGVCLAHDLAAKIALIAGLVALAPALVRPRAVLRGLAGLAVAGSLLAPLAALHLPPPDVSAQWPGLPASAHHRLTIWSFTARHILEKPLLGWGFDGARAIPGGKTELGVVWMKGCNGDQAPIMVPGYDRPVPADCVLWEEQLPLHPHDSWLQAWLELGAAGALVIALLLGVVIAAPVRRATGDAGLAPLAAAVASGLVVCSVSFGAWQSWWLSTLWIAAALALPLLPDDVRDAGHGLGNRAPLV
ncbi:MAG: O-antigen ligase family protein [Telmatospirillum sp.]|nr:O-antigen ligase family protein [Telmatospirillum sp.]